MDIAKKPESILLGPNQEWKPMMPLTTLRPPTRMWWCSDCQRYCAAHPLDHLDDVHPPQHVDGSHALPERIEFAA